MFRRVFTVLSALSLQLCLVMGLLMWRSLRVRDLYDYTASVQIGPGRF
jgi:hypothetical protein